MIYFRVMLRIYLIIICMRDANYKNDTLEKIFHYTFTKYFLFTFQCIVCIRQKSDFFKKKFKLPNYFFTESIFNYRITNQNIVY